MVGEMLREQFGLSDHTLSALAYAWEESGQPKWAKSFDLGDCGFIPYLSLQSNPKHGWFTSKFVKPHVNAPGQMSCLPFALALNGKAMKTYQKQRVQLWLVNLLVSRACFQKGLSREAWLHSKMQKAYHWQFEGLVVGSQ